MTESDVCENNEAEFREMKQKAQISHEIENVLLITFGEKFINLKIIYPLLFELKFSELCKRVEIGRDETRVGLLLREDVR